MTDINIDAIRRRADRYASLDDSGPAWASAGIACAEDVPDLLAEVDRLRDGIEQVAVELDRSDDTADQADALRALLEHKQCPSCAPGYDCERGIYTKAVAR